jgi:hypothetical protein
MGVMMKVLTSKPKNSSFSLVSLLVAKGAEYLDEGTCWFNLVQKIRGNYCLASVQDFLNKEAVGFV